MERTINQLPLPLSMLSPGVVIRYEFQFEDNIKKHKERPVVIIAFNKGKIIAVGIKGTSQEYYGFYDYLLKHPEDAGLEKGTTFRCNKLAKIDTKAVYQIYGKLHNEDFKNIKKLFEEYLKREHPEDYYEENWT